MSEYLHFFYNHIELSLAFIVLLLLVLWEELGSKRYSRAGIPPQTLVTLMNHEGALVLDIRTPEAFKQGHITGALNVPAQTLETNLKKLIKYKNSPVVVVDETGQASIRVLGELKKNNFQKLHLLSGGLAAWKQAGLPLTEGTNKR